MHFSPKIQKKFEFVYAFKILRKFTALVQAKTKRHNQNIGNASYAMFLDELWSFKNNKSNITWWYYLECICSIFIDYWLKIMRSLDTSRFSRYFYYAGQLHQSLNPNTSLSGVYQIYLPKETPS